MTTEEKLKQLILTQYGTMREFCNQVDIKQSTLATVLTRGIHSANVTTVIKICRALGISADALAEDRIVPINGTPDHNFFLKEMDDILNFYRVNIDGYKEITVGGMPMEPEDAELLVDAMEITIKLIKRKKRAKMKN